MPTYKTKNWPAYTKALKRRGSLTIWFDPGMIWGGEPSGKRSRSRTFSGTAIQTCLTIACQVIVQQSPSRDESAVQDGASLDDGLC